MGVVVEGAAVVGVAGEADAAPTEEVRECADGGGDVLSYVRELQQRDGEDAEEDAAGTPRGSVGESRSPHAPSYSPSLVAKSIRVVRRR